MAGTTVLGNMVLRVTGETKDFQNGIDEAKEKSIEFQGEIQGSKLSLTDFKSGLIMAKEALEMVGQAFSETVGFAIDYGMEIKDTSALLGVNATEASTLIQVMDDLRVESSVLEMASKKLKDDGLLPNLETLIDLSAEYKSIQDPVARATFLFDKFGRSGVEMQRVLEAGPEALREMGQAAAETGLVMDEQFVQEMDDARLVLDEFNDMADATKIKIGVWFVSGVVDARKATHALNEALERGVLTNAEYMEIMGQVRRGEIDYSEAVEYANQKVEWANQLDQQRIEHLQNEYPVVVDVADATWGEALALEYAAEATAAANTESLAYLDSIFLVRDAIGEVSAKFDEGREAQDLFREGLGLITDSMIEQERITAVLALATGDLTVEEFAARMEMIQSLEAQQALNDALETGTITKYDWIAAMADGVVTQEEVNELLGITNDEMSEEEANLIGINKQLDNLDGKVANAVVNIQVNQTGGGGGNAEVNVYMAGGGSFWANGPTVMMVGEGSEREYVSVIPESQMAEGAAGGGVGGDTYYVTINDRMAARLWMDQQRQARESRIEGLM